MMDPRTWSFNIDRYLNHVVPPPPWRHLPYAVTRFFGYRPSGHKATPTGNLLPIFYAFVGIFCGIALIEGVSMNIPSFEHHDAPLIVASFGAAAVLEFYAIDSPLAQPRNAIVGQALSAFIGVSICKLFLLAGDDGFHSLRWLGGALACAAATAIMALTKTVHPPAGATALMAVTDPRIVRLGWFLIPVMGLGCGLMMAVALLVNNVGRRFPLYWWTPEDLPMTKRRKMRAVGGDKKREEEGTAGGAPAASQSQASPASHGATKADDDSCENCSQDMTSVNGKDIIIRRGSLIVPDHLNLSQEEVLFLESLSQRL